MIRSTLESAKKERKKAPATAKQSLDNGDNVASSAHQEIRTQLLHSDLTDAEKKVLWTVLSRLEKETVWASFNKQERKQVRKSLTAAEPPPQVAVAESR